MSGEQGVSCDGAPVGAVAQRFHRRRSVQRFVNVGERKCFILPAQLWSFLLLTGVSFQVTPMLS